MGNIQIKIDDEHKKIIQATAKSEYLSLSAFMKKLALDFAKSKQEVLTHQHENQRE